MLTRLLPLAMLILSGCAHFSDIEEFPKAFRRRLQSQPAWLTVTSFDNPRGVFPPAETSVIKRWETKRSASGASSLQEVASSSFLGVMDALRRGKSPRRSVRLSGEVDMTAFFPYPSHALRHRNRFQRDRYDFVDLGAGRFEILINGGRGRVVFAPAPASSTKAVSARGKRDLGVWATPFGAEGELVTHLGKLVYDEETPELPDELKPGPYLHHDLGGRGQSRARVPIVLDQSFPAAFRPAAARAVAKWNAGLGAKVFVLEQKAVRMSPGDCLSGRKLCIRWIGTPKIVVTGANGFTELAFDPATGVILGGIISVINDDVSPPLRKLSQDDEEKLKASDRTWIVDAMSRSFELNHYLHPEPGRYLEYLLLHEMGHFNGLGHNFHTSDATTPLRPVTSVMTYPPFPVAHRANYIGEADLARIGIVYRDAPVPAELPYCSTFVTMAPEQSDDGFYRKPANCDMFTLGDAGAWYMQLAKRGQDGVFTQFPDLSHLSEELQAFYLDTAASRGLPPLNILTRLGYILGDASESNRARRATVTAYLCGLAQRRDEVAEQLATYHDVQLMCPSP